MAHSLVTAQNLTKVQWCSVDIYVLLCAYFKMRLLLLRKTVTLWRIKFIAAVGLVAQGTLSFPANGESDYEIVT